MTFEQIMQSEEFVPNMEQRPVIESVRNTVVSAGAGAGKTAVLSWRFLRLVMEEKVRPDQILTLTFTKKAANEMRQRIYQRLIKAKDSIPQDSLDSFRRATISTLDSFCAQIVRSDSISYGFSRDMGNLSEEDLSDMAQRLAQGFLSDPENREESSLLASLDMPPAIMNGFFLTIASRVSLAGDYNADRISRDFVETVREVYLAKRTRLGELLDRLGAMSLRGAFANQYDRIRYLFDNQCFTSSDYFNLRGVKDEEVKELVGEIKPILGKDTGFSILQDIANGSTQTPVLQRAVEKFANLVNSEKRRLGVMTFRDVSELSVLALRDNLQLRSVYKNRFRFIMIDEFQDNNRVQRDLLFLLAERTDIPGEKGRIPALEDLDRNKLFFVGDEKQSVYSFRGADVSVFRHLQQEIGVNGDSLSLSTNYRSQKKLIDHFNDVFSQVLSEGERDYHARYNPILCGRKPDGTLSRIIFSVYNKNAIEDEDMDGGILEAEAIGDYCIRILQTDEFLVEGERPKPEDIAIIFRSSTNQMNIEKALKRRNIDYQIAETRSLMLDAVSSDFYSLLNLVLYPEDKRSLVAALKSPFCGLCEQSIHNVVVENADVLPTDRRRHELFLSFLESLRQNAFRLSIACLVQFIYIEGGYKAYLQSDDDRRTFAEHYEYIFSYAVAFDRDGKNLNDFVKFLRDNLGTSTKLPEANVLHSSRSGVQIMTVHKSKGLEFKVVIFAGIGGRTQADKSALVFEYGGNLVASEDRSIRKILDEDRQDRDKAELKRIMYVALTRAKDHLILIGGYSLKEGKYTISDVMQWYADSIGMDFDTMECKNPDVEVHDVTKTQRNQGTRNRNGKQITIPSEFKEFKIKETRISVTGHDDLGRNPYEGVSKCDVLKTTDLDDLIAENGLQDKFGTLCHLVLEKTMKGEDTDDIESRLFENPKDNDRVLQQALGYADGFLKSELYTHHISGNANRPELRFYTCPVGLDDVAVEGVMDLLVLGEKTNLVVDYKTDIVRNPEIHKTQVLFYVKVAEEIFSKPCLGVLFYLRNSSTGPVWDRNGNCVELPSSL